MQLFKFIKNNKPSWSVGAEWISIASTRTRTHSAAECVCFAMYASPRRHESTWCAVPFSVRACDRCDRCDRACMCAYIKTNYDIDSNDYIARGVRVPIAAGMHASMHADAIIGRNRRFSRARALARPSTVPRRSHGARTWSRSTSSGRILMNCT